MAENNTGNGDNSGNGDDNGGSTEAQSLQQTWDTTRNLLQASLDAGVPAPEALDNSRPRNWQS